MKISRWYDKLKNLGKKDPYLTYSDYDSYYPDYKKKTKLKLGKTKSIVTLFRRKLKLKESKWNVFLANLYEIPDLDNKALKKTYSVKGSEEKLLESMINDYKTGKLPKKNLKKYDLNPENITKEQLHSMIDDYRNYVKNNKPITLNVSDLKNRFTIKESRLKVLEKLVRDYKKGKLSNTVMLSQKQFQPSRLNKRRLNLMLRRYEAERKEKQKNTFLGKSKTKIAHLRDDLRSIYLQHLPEGHN